jgi:hypothetical protein
VTVLRLGSPFRVLIWVKPALQQSAHPPVVELVVDEVEVEVVELAVLEVDEEEVDEEEVVEEDEVVGMEVDVEEVLEDDVVAGTVDVVVVVAGGAVVVVVVGSGHVAVVARGSHSRIRVFTSFRLSFVLTITLTFVFPAFVLCFFVATLAVKAPHAELVPDFGSVGPTTTFFLTTFTFFRSPDRQEPAGLLAQMRKVNTHDPLAVV